MPKVTNPTRATLALVLILCVVAFGIYRLAHWHARKPGVIYISTTTGFPAPTAPHLTLTDLSGKTLDTSDLRGKVVVVNFWAAWCGPCAEEVPSFIALQRKYQEQVQIIGVSIDDAESDLRNFCQKSGMNYPIIIGNQQIAQAYGGILGLPTTFIIDPAGRIRKKLTGSTDFRAIEQEIVTLLGKPNPQT